MLRSRSTVALLFLFGVVAPAFGQDTADIQWKFEKGKTFFQEMATKTDQKMKVMGQEVNQNQEQTFYFSWTARDQDDKTKNWNIVQKIEGVKMKIEIGGSPVTFDSTKPDANANNPLTDFFKAIVGSEFTLTISPEFKVVEVKGKEEFIKKLVAANPQMEPLLRQILNDDSLKQMADPAFGVAPNKSVKKGESWEKPATKLDMGPIGTYQTAYKYTFDGLDEKDKNLANIKVETTLTYTPPGDTTASTLPFKIKTADLKSKDATGTVHFDIAKGRVADSKLGMKLEGKLGIDISGMNTEVELNQTQETNVKTSDTNPVSATPAPAPPTTPPTPPPATTPTPSPATTPTPPPATTPTPPPATTPTPPPPATTPTPAPATKPTPPATTPTPPPATTPATAPKTP